MSNKDKGIDKSSDEVFNAYLRQLKVIPLLDAEQEKELACKIKSGDKLAKKKLIESNLRLVVTVSRSYKARGISIMDIIQEGNIGLMQASERFDGERNIRFSTYAVYWIKQSIRRYLDSKNRAIHLPVRKEDMLRKLTATEQYLRQTLGRSPRMEELANATGYELDDVTMLYNAMSAPVSLESDVQGIEDGSPIIDICEDTSRATPEDECVKEFCRNETRRILKRNLDNREHRIIIHHFRFVQSDLKTLKDLGTVMGITSETVRQIEKRALKKLRAAHQELSECAYA
ncbi:hypothetical protein AGMMS50212_08310 [Spirochaetia bacterium]|nr:hypothetical protein AGMMS50212_08310 [Spirochaetia bacterium]